MSSPGIKYRLRHRTTYAYVEPVDLATHMLHMSPRATPQQCVAAQVAAVQAAIGFALA